MKAHFDLSSETSHWEQDVFQTFGSVTVSQLPDLPNATLVTLPCRLVAAEIRTLPIDLNLQLAENEPELVMDFGAVKEIDTEALVILLQCIGEVLRRDGSFTVRRMSPEAATFIELTGMDHLIEIPSTEMDFSPEYDFVSAVELERSETGSRIAAA